MKTHVAHMITWIELERGWGQRLDGVSLHRTPEEATIYIGKYWEGMPETAPDEYSRPDSTITKLVAVSDEMFKSIAATAKGLRLLQHEYRDSCESGDIKE